MSLAIYKILHIIGIVMSLTAVGALALQATTGEADKSKRMPAIIAHGVGMLLALVAGFGMMARMGLSFSDNLWLFAKIAIWLVVGGSVAIIKRKPGKALAVWWSVPVITAVAAWLAIYKPF